MGVHFESEHSSFSGTVPPQLEHHHYRSLVEQSPAPTLLSIQGRIAFANQASARLFRAPTPEQLVGIALLDLASPDRRESAAHTLLGQIEHPEEVFEETFVRLDGQLIDVEIACISITHQGKPATHLIIRDLTERKRREAERLS